MPLAVSWGDLALRLALTVMAGALIGLNRDEHGRPAGLRTTLLVCLAASVSMIQANLLLPKAGKTSDSFVVLDLMWLPLGILTGMGFIGAGAIIRRPDLVLGVTTAATLWMVTVIGLCFGGGQLILGLCGTAIGFVVLWGLKLAERYIRQDRRAMLTVSMARDTTIGKDISCYLEERGYRTAGQAASYGPERCEIDYDLRWYGTRLDVGLPAFLPELAKHASVQTLRWAPHGLAKL